MARCTASRAVGLTAVDPLTTRETVDRDTPAAAATSSIVTARRDVSVLMETASPRMLCVGAGSRVEGSLGDDPRVGPSAVLHRTLLGVVVDADDAEPLLVPPGPLEVVQQRPVEVAAHIDPGLDRVEDRAEMHTEELRALVVVHTHLAVLDDGLVVVGGTVLGDVEDGAGGRRVLGRDALQEARQPLGLHL